MPGGCARWMHCDMSDSPAATAPRPLIEARDVHKAYTIGRRTLEVLRGVDLAVGRGEFLALRGSSGAGKSTLLHLLGGLDAPNRGEVFHDGRGLSKFDATALASFRNRRVGFI